MDRKESEERRETSAMIFFIFYFLFFYFCRWVYSPGVGGLIYVLRSWIP
jgi:hypothetical protein